MFTVISSSIISNSTTVQGQQNIFHGSRVKPALIANSRKVLGAEGRLVTLAPHVSGIVQTTQHNMQG